LTFFFLLVTTLTVQSALPDGRNFSSGSAVTFPINVICADITSPLGVCGFLLQ
jgi:hypothetical protein